MKTTEQKTKDNQSVIEEQARQYQNDQQTELVNLDYKIEILTKDINESLQRIKSLGYPYSQMSDAERQMILETFAGIKYKAEMILDTCFSIHARTYNPGSS